MPTPLEQLANEFEHWRSTRKKRTHTPQHLREKTLAILPQYQISEVLSALKLSPSALSRWKRDAQQPSHITDVSAPEFVPLDTTSSALNVAPCDSSPAEISIRYPSGLTLSFKGVAPLSEFVNLHHQLNQAKGER